MTELWLFLLALSVAYLLPGPDMILDAANYLKIDLAASYMVGDKSSDMKAAAAAGVGHKILVKTGKALTDDGIALAHGVYPSLVEFAEALPSVN